MSALYTLPTLADAYDPTNPNAGLSTDDPLYIPDVLGQVRPQTTDQSQAQSSALGTDDSSLLDNFTQWLGVGTGAAGTQGTNTALPSGLTPGELATGIYPQMSDQSAALSTSFSWLYSSRLILLFIGLLLFAAGIFAFKPTQQLIEKATRNAGESAA
jgi:hypothetical protein